MRPHGKYAQGDAANPAAFGQCDRCGFWYNLHDLAFQKQWAGTRLYSTGALVCTTGNRCYDRPQEQLRTILLPPDPLPVLNARVPNFAYEEQTVLIAQYSIGAPKQPTPNAQPPWGAGPAMILCDQTGELALLMQYTTSS